MPTDKAPLRPQAPPRTATRQQQLERMNEDRRREIDRLERRTNLNKAIITVLFLVVAVGATAALGADNQAVLTLLGIVGGYVLLEVVAYLARK